MAAKSSLLNMALCLTAVCLVCAAVLGVTYSVTKEPIEAAAMAEAQIQKIVAEAVSRAIESIYSATQAGIQIASAPQVAPIADQLLKSAGFEDKDQPPIVAPPGLPMAPDAGAAADGDRRELPHGRQP